MKKIEVLLIATLSLCMLASCSQDAKEEQDDPILVPVTVHVNDFSITQDNIPTNRAAAIESVSSVKAITLAFFASDGSQAYKHTQFKNDASTFTTYGEFSTSLPYGSYTMVVLGYGQGSAAQEITLTGPTAATFGEGRVRDTFSATQAVDITNSNAVELSATLDRIVSALAVRSTDNRPAEVASMRFTFSKGGKSFNPTSGLATENAGFVDLMEYTTAAGTTTNTGTYLFLAIDEQTMNVTIETLNADGAVLFSKTVNNVPFKRDRQTILTGPLYSNSGVSVGSFMVNNEWITAYNMDL